MYLIDKYQNKINELESYIPFLIFTPVVIWSLNGGKNDFGIVHHLVIYMSLTGLAIILLLFLVFIFLALCDMIIWLCNR